ncbi:MAG: DUF3859 domain-containing protein [Microcystaceae cyanobacterium]
MEPRLTDAQLEKVVAEVQQLSQQTQAELAPEQVRDILQELSLPPELLEEAMVQLDRREALAAQQKRDRLLMGGFVGLIALSVIGFLVFTQNQQQMTARVTAQRDRVTLNQDNGGNLSTISRQNNDEIFYRITLADAPVGQRLSLSCNWIDPSGQIVHQNRYQTKEITTPIWNTFCRHQLGSEMPVGIWKVEAFLGDRRLSDASFEVK